MKKSIKGYKHKGKRIKEKVEKEEDDVEIREILDRYKVKKDE